MSQIVVKKVVTGYLNQQHRQLYSTTSAPINIPGAAGGRYGAQSHKIKRLSIEQGDTKSGGNRLRSTESERSEQEEIYKISASIASKEIINSRIVFNCWINCLKLS